MKQFVTEESFWELFPEAQIGIVVAHNMKPTEEVAPEDAAAIARALAEANSAADQHLESNTISQNEVVAVWREAYQKFKTKKGARCSIENLLKRVLKGNPVGSITPSVDIYNTVSLTYALPVGGEDIDAMASDIPRRRRRHLSLLELARRRAHGADRCIAEGLPHHRVRGSGSRRRSGGGDRPTGRHGAAVLGRRYLRQTNHHPRQPYDGDRRIVRVRKETRARGANGPAGHSAPPYQERRSR